MDELFSDIIGKERAEVILKALKERKPISADEESFLAGYINVCEDEGCKAECREELRNYQEGRHSAENDGE